MTRALRLLIECSRSVRFQLRVCARRYRWSEATLVQQQCSRFASTSHGDGGDIRKDLDGAAGYLDFNTAADDPWPSSPYPELASQAAGKIDAQEPEVIEADDTSVILFPGQGSQFVGMGKELLGYPSVKDMYSVASDILGYDLLDICLNGPLERLTKTRYQQPAILVTSLAASQKLNELSSPAIRQCAMTAGFSAGEIAAFVFAGSLSFENAVRLIKVRADAMQKASEERSSGLLRIFEGRRTSVGAMCKEAINHVALGVSSADGPICRTSHYLFPKCRVLGGDLPALKFIEENAPRFYLRRNLKYLPVSGAFHTPLMQSAIAPVREVLWDMEVKDPKIPVYANYNAKPVTTGRQAKRALLRQLITSVKWQQIVTSIYTRPPGTPFPTTWEVGPGTQLGVILNRTNTKAFRHYHAVPV